MESKTNGAQFAGSDHPMKAYRYTLEPYNGPETRHTCPQCGAPNRFVRYIDTATGQYIADDCGRCNREDSCGYHLKPSDYFSLHPDRAGEYKPTRRDKAPAIVEAYMPAPPLESYTIPKTKIESFYKSEAKEEVTRLSGAQRWPYRCYCSMEDRITAICRSAFSTSAQSSTLAKYLFKTIGRDKFRKTADLYHLASWRGAAVFWYIDIDKHIRTGKAMYYKEDGHRNKDYSPFYMHSIINGVNGPGLPEDWRLRRCLFGEHLLARNPDAPVMLVESEKTAMIAAALTEGFGVWLAAGGKRYLNADSCAGLKGRRVIAYPDLGAFDSWRNDLQTLADQCCFNVIISDFLEQRATDEDKAAGLDIADYLLKEIE